MEEDKKGLMMERPLCGYCKTKPAFAVLEGKFTCGDCLMVWNGAEEKKRLKEQKEKQDEIAGLIKNEK